VIDTELSRTKAAQPDKEEHEQDFRKIEEIVEPVKRRSPLGMAESLVVRIATSISTNKATQARLERNPTVSKDPQTNSTPDTKISHQAGKRDLGLNERWRT
jgi:hypothetical protein